jgi:protein-tyrosine-phosphatase
VSRRITDRDWSEFSVIAALEMSVLERLEKTCPGGATAKLVLFTGLDGIADPYDFGEDAFRAMYAGVAGAMGGFLEEHGLEGDDCANGCRQE